MNPDVCVTGECVCVCACGSSCLLNAQTQVEQVVGGVRRSVRSLHFSDEAAEAVAQLAGGAAEDIFV